MLQHEEFDFSTGRNAQHFYLNSKIFTRVPFQLAVVTDGHSIVAVLHGKGGNALWLWKNIFKKIYLQAAFVNHYSFVSTQVCTSLL